MDTSARTLRLLWFRAIGPHILGLSLLVLIGLFVIPRYRPVPNPQYDVESARYQELQRVFDSENSRLKREYDDQVEAFSRRTIDPTLTEEVQRIEERLVLLRSEIAKKNSEIKELRRPYGVTLKPDARGKLSVRREDVKEIPTEKLIRFAELKGDVETLQLQADTEFAQFTEARNVVERAKKALAAERPKQQFASGTDLMYQKQTLASTPLLLGESLHGWSSIIAGVSTGIALCVAAIVSLIWMHAHCSTVTATVRGLLYGVLVACLVAVATAGIFMQIALAPSLAVSLAAGVYCVGVCFLGVMTGFPSSVRRLVRDSERDIHRKRMEEAAIQGQREAEQARRAQEQIQREAQDRAEQEEAAKRQHEAERQRAADEQKIREHEEFLQSERHHRCKSDGFHFPLQLIAKCPKCGSGDVEQVRAGEPESNGHGSPINPDLFKKTFEDKIDAGDFIGVGNLILEGITRLGQSKEPDEISTYLAEVVPDVVATKFDVPETFSYAAPHSDWHMPPHFRRQWQADTFHQLCIFAYVLGATWKVLPNPHGGLIDYYHWMAAKQEEMILDAREKVGSSARRYRASDL